MLSRGTLIPW